MELVLNFCLSKQQFVHFVTRVCSEGFWEIDLTAVAQHSWLHSVFLKHNDCLNFTPEITALEMNYLEHVLAVKYNNSQCGICDDIYICIVCKCLFEWVQKKVQRGRREGTFYGSKQRNPRLAEMLWTFSAVSPHTLMLHLSWVRFGNLFCLVLEMKDNISSVLNTYRGRVHGN